MMLTNNHNIASSKSLVDRYRLSRDFYAAAQINNGLPFALDVDSPQSLRVI